MKRHVFKYAALAIFSIADFCIAQQDVRIHGFISQGYMKSTDNNYLLKSKDGCFEFNEAAVNMMAIVSDNAQIGVQFLARDFGEAGNHTVLLDWAYSDYNFNSSFGLRLGKIKIPLGLYNQGRDVDLLRTPILLPQSVYDESMRDFSLAILGIGTYGNLSLSSFGQIDYEIVGGTLSIPDSKSAYWNWVLTDLIDVFKGYSSYFDTHGSGFQVNQQKVSGKSVVGGSIQLETPLTGLTLKASKAFGKLNMNSILNLPVVTFNIDVIINQFNTYSMQYHYGNFSLTGEYHLHEYFTDISYKIPSMEHKLPRYYWESDGYYGQIGYRFSNWFETCMYYSEYFPDTNDREGKNKDVSYEGWQKDLSLTLRFDLTQRWLVKLEAHRMDGVALIRVDTDQSKERDWELFMLKTTFQF